MLCFLETPVLRFALLPYYRRYYRYLSQKNPNHIGDLFENNGEMRGWEHLRAKLGLDDSKKFYWRKIIHAIPLAWKEMFLECGNNISDLIINEHHLINKYQIYCLKKLNVENYKICNLYLK